MKSFPVINLVYFLLPGFVISGDVKELFDGGSAMTPVEFPWHVGLLEKPYRKLFCGGSILTENYVLTSGKCVSRWLPENETSVTLDPAAIRLIAGDHNRMDDEEWEQMRDVVEIITHPQFKYDPAYKGKQSNGPKGFSNDLAIMRVDPPFNFTEGVQPIQLISRVSQDIDKFEIAGWGITDKKQNTIPTGSYRKKAEIPFNGPQTKVSKKQFGFTLVNGTLLEFNTGIGMNSGLMGRCIGDTGGSLVCREQGPHSPPSLCGIISFGIWCDRYMGSGQSFLFTDSEIDWITSITHPKFWIYMAASGSLCITLIVLAVAGKLVMDKRRRSRTYKV